MTILPKGSVCYKETAPFTPDNLPEKFRNNHHTKKGVWGEIRMQSGILALKRHTSANDSNITEELTLEAGQTAVFGPQEPHSVEFLEDGAFVVAFYRLEDEQTSAKPSEGGSYPVNFSKSEVGQDTEHD
jgi:tellurite resistance-related uncharacterized protein